MTPDIATAHDRVGPYQLIKAIGAGGSARIDLARIDRAYGFQRHVVIKRPLEHLRGDPKAAASLRREARIGARLRHPNLVAILDAGTHDGYDYLVLEYVHGGALRTLVEGQDPQRLRDVPQNVAIAMIGDVARALHDAHELTDEGGNPLGLVHRDVSPGNILIGLDGAAKLADFGIAKETRVQTLSGSMHGTVTYMAPEQCRGHAFDRRADVFSLGVVLYELLTGTRLFWADNDVASLHRVLSGNVPRPRKLRPQIAPALEEIVMTAVAHDQDRRFATARDLADALEIYAGEAGEILGARWIARWAADILGPRDVPWNAAATIPDLAFEEEASLVEIIAAVPAEPEPPIPTFGPTAPSFSDEIDTSPRRTAPGRSRKRMATVIALGLLGGAGVTGLVMSQHDQQARAPDPARVDPPPTPSPSPAPVVVEQAPSPSPTAEPTEIEIEPDKLPTRSRRRHNNDAVKPEPSPTPSPIVAEESKPSPSPSPSVGSGSQVTPPTRPKIWSPGIFLPSDSGSGTKKK